jgi:LPS-assembly protein
LDKDDGSQSVFVPQASIDAGLHFYQAGSPFGAFDDTLGGYRLLSPRLKYTYSPYRRPKRYSKL